MIQFESIKNLNEEQVYDILKAELKTFDLDNRTIEYADYYYIIAKILKQTKYQNKNIKHLIYDNKETFK